MLRGDQVEIAPIEHSSDNEDRVPLPGALVAVLSGMGRADQRATAEADQGISGSVLIRLIVSRVIFLARCTAHSSF